MRDAESMLDQLLSAAPDRIDEAHVRDLLGLADAEVVDQFVDFLIRGDAAAGVALLDTLDERGRDVRALLDQVVDAIRLELVAGLAGPNGARHEPAALAAAGRRIAAIDPNRAGIGGLRFQLELALFRATEGVGMSTPALSREREPTERPRPAEQRARSEAPAAPDPQPRALEAPKETRRAAPAKSSASTATPTTPPPKASPEPEPPIDGTAEAAKPSFDPPATPAAGGAPDLERLTDGWAEVVASVGPATRAIINECRPLSVEGNVVTLGFPEAKGFLKDVAERKAKELDAAVGAFLGRAVNVRCVATNIEIAVTASPDSAFVLAEARRIFADDIVDVGEIS
jgi:hypothetical protein